MRARTPRASPFYLEALRAALAQFLFDVRETAGRSLELECHLNGLSEALTLARRLAEDKDVPVLDGQHPFSIQTSSDYRPGQARMGMRRGPGSGSGAAAEVEAPTGLGTARDGVSMPGCAQLSGRGSCLSWASGSDPCWLDFFTGLRLTSTPPIMAKPITLSRGAPGIPGPLAR